MTSPIRLIVIRPTASQWPQRDIHQRPNDAAAQNIETVNNKKTAQRPRLVRLSCARGLIRHIALRKPFGRSKEMLAVRLMAAPARKKTLSAVIPHGRRLSELVVKVRSRHLSLNSR